MDLELYIGAGHPALAGHFPGNPVVPAVVIVQMIAGRLEEATGVVINEVRQLRLQRPLRPGERAQVRCEARAESAWRVTVTVNGQVVAKGTFGKRSGTIRSAGLTPTGPRTSFEAGSAYQCLPHSGDMALIDTFEQDELGTSFTSITQHEAHPLEERGQLLPWVSLEYAAQLYGCSALLSANGGRGGAMSHAYIVLVRSLQVDASLSLDAGKSAEVAIGIVSGQDRAAQCVFETCLAGYRWCRGEFTVLSGAQESDY